MKVSEVWSTDKIKNEFRGECFQLLITKSCKEAIKGRVDLKSSKEAIKVRVDLKCLCAGQ